MTDEKLYRRIFDLEKRIDYLSSLEQPRHVATVTFGAPMLGIISGAPTLGQIGTSGGDERETQAWTFADGNVEGVGTNFMYPGEITASKVTMHGYWTTAATTGNGYFTLSVRGISPGQDALEIPSAQEMHETIQVAAPAAASDLVAATASALITGGISASSMVRTVFRRLGDNANDTLSSAVYFFGMGIYFD